MADGEARPLRWQPVVLVVGVVLVVLVAGGAIFLYTEQDQLRFVGQKDRQAHGTPIDADPKSLVLTASDVGNGFTLNTSKSDYDRPPCDIDEVSGDGRISAYEATINPAPTGGWVESSAYKYTTEAKAESSFQGLVAATTSGIDVGICRQGLRYPTTLVETSPPTDLPSGIHSFEAGGSKAFVWRNRNIVEKLNIAVSEPVNVLELVRRQNVLAASR